MAPLAHTAIVVIAGLALRGDVRARQPTRVFTYADGSLHPVTEWGEPALQGASANHPQWMGDPRGGWEGKTLLVETTNFNGRPHAHHGDARQAARRLALPADPEGDAALDRISERQIHFEMTVEDADVLTDEWTVSSPMHLEPDYTFYECAWHDGHTAIRNFIEALRYERGLRLAATPAKD